MESEVIRAAVAGGTTVLQSGLTARLLIASRQPKQLTVSDER